MSGWIPLTPIMNNQSLPPASDIAFWAPVIVTCCVCVCAVHLSSSENTSRQLVKLININALVCVCVSPLPLSREQSNLSLAHIPLCVRVRLEHILYIAKLANFCLDIGYICKHISWPGTCLTNDTRHTHTEGREMSNLCLLTPLTLR